ncbi:MAG: hypothetical protein AB7J40_02710 [Candidatus Altimarinota bacterium]
MASFPVPADSFELNDGDAVPLRKVFADWYLSTGPFFSSYELTSRLAAHSLDDVPLQYVGQAIEILRGMVQKLLADNGLKISLQQQEGKLLEFSISGKSGGTWQVFWRLSDVLPRNTFGESTVLEQYQEAPLQVEDFPKAVVFALRGFFKEAVQHAMV